ncbi:helix-turn-helix domain-containing protein [Catenulispora subtropica]|uniref:Transcriptional regulator, PucR family n=1 Tax=Catenulispora subtropica TaxID=450798 RepID=A0ABN2R5W8_9ACTN
MTSPRTSLGRIIADLGVTLVELVAGRSDPATPVAGVLIHDRLDEPARLPGAIVLGVGVYGPEHVAALVDHAGGLGAAAVVVRSPVVAQGPVAEAAARTGVVVLGLTPGASWAQVAALLRSLISADATAAGPAPGPEAPLAGDLFQLANAIAGLLDGPVTIEDRGGGVLAFSARQDEADDSRIATILDRQVPADKLRDLEQRGAFHAIYRSDDPVYIAGVGEKPRVAIAVRAGGEILGSIWVVVPGPLNDDRAQAFREAANVAALHLLRSRSGADADRRLRADLLATVLEGGPQAPQAAARLGLAAQRACVLALAVATPGGSGVGGGSSAGSSSGSEERMVGSAERGAGDRGGAERAAAADRAVVADQAAAERADDAERAARDRAAADRAAAEARLAGALALHLSAIHPHTAVASLGSITYAVLPAATEEDARRVIEAFLARAGARVPICVAIGRCADHPTGLRRSRTDADRALRVLQSRTARPAHDPQAPHRIARLSDVYAASLLRELADRLAADDDVPSGPVIRLRAHDRRHGTAFAASLAAWLDAFGDVNAAAAKVHVHPNTFRYRLRRLAEVSGLDLSDPEARFEAMVQLRLMPPEG